MNRTWLALVEIGKDGEPRNPVGPLSDTVGNVCEKTADLYRQVGSYSPWRVRDLIRTVKDTAPGTTIFAFTLPEKNASNRVLRKLQFVFGGKTHDEDELVLWRRN